MTHPSDPLLVDAMWRAADLTRAYLAQDRARVASCLTNLDTGLLERIAGWLVLDHDQLFVRLGEPTMSLSRLKDVAALAPAETEFARPAQPSTGSPQERPDSPTRWKASRCRTRSTPVDPAIALIAGLAPEGDRCRRAIGALQLPAPR